MLSGWGGCPVLLAFALIQASRVASSLDYTVSLIGALVQEAEIRATASPVRRSGLNYVRSFDVSTADTAASAASELADSTLHVLSVAPSHLPAAVGPPRGSASTGNTEPEPPSLVGGGTPRTPAPHPPQLREKLSVATSLDSGSIRHAVGVNAPRGCAGQTRSAGSGCATSRGTPAPAVFRRSLRLSVAERRKQRLRRAAGDVGAAPLASYQDYPWALPRADAPSVGSSWRRLHEEHVATIKVIALTQIITLGYCNSRAKSQKACYQDASLLSRTVILEHC
jgi:hypothetical protein